MFRKTDISKSSTFWLDKPTSRAVLANGTAYSIFPRTLRDDSDPVLDIWGDADCITLFASGFSLPSDLTLYPINIEWILVPAITCVFDTDMPLASAVTSFTSPTDQRSGLVLRASGFRLDRTILYARIVARAISHPSVKAQLYAVGDLRGTHRTNIEVGSVVG